MPGEYKVIVKKGDHVDSTMISVKIDPRSELGRTDFEANIKAQKNFEKTVLMATEAFDRIMKAKKTVKKVKGLMENQDKEIKTEVDSLSKLITTELDSLAQLYMMPEGLKGIQRKPGLLNGKIRNASYAISGSWGKPGANSDNVVNTAKREVKTTVEAVNTFIDGQWKSYEARIKEIQLKIFEDMEKVKIE